MSKQMKLFLVGVPMAVIIAMLAAMVYHISDLPLFVKGALIILIMTCLNAMRMYVQDVIKD